MFSGIKTNSWEDEKDFSGSINRAREDAANMGLAFSEVEVGDGVGAQADLRNRFFNGEVRALEVDVDIDRSASIIAGRQFN